MKTILLTGGCGTGKTWVAKELIKRYELYEEVKAGLWHWRTNGKMIVLGKYTGATFEGGDALSMAVMKDINLVKPYFEGKVVFAEGDRFTNSTFINEFNPYIIRIYGSGLEGREKRGTEQTARHIRAIATRVNNIEPDDILTDSAAALRYIIEGNERGIDWRGQPKTKPGADFSDLNKWLQ